MRARRSTASSFTAGSIACSTRRLPTTIARSEPRRATSGPACDSLRRRTEVVRLAKLNAVVAQQRVGRRDMEVEVRGRVVLQVGLTLERHGAVAARDHDVLVFGSVDLRGAHRLDKCQRLADALAQF